MASCSEALGQIDLIAVTCQQIVMNTVKGIPVFGWRHQMNKATFELKGFCIIGFCKQLVRLM